MSQSNRRFIILPYCFNLPALGLQYKDLLTYVALRSFNNSTAELCFPSLESIGKVAGVSKKFVRQSIARLSKAKLIVISKSSKRRVSNRYSFNQSQQFSKIPYEIFDTDDLTACEKGMLICLRQFFSSASLKLMLSGGITSIAHGLGLSYNTVYTQYKSLVAKGYIQGDITQATSDCFVKAVLTDKLDWQFSTAQQVKTPTTYEFLCDQDGFIKVVNKEVTAEPRSSLSALFYC